MSDGRLRVMAIMAHQDDFEVTAGGTFALLRKSLGDDVDLHVLATSRGAAGHHEMTTDESFAIRQREASEGAALVGATYECLKQLDGSHVEIQVLINRSVLGGLWNAIRAFEPDVIFTHSVVADPLAGVHVDHINTARAVRLVAYQICAPNAYPTMNAPRRQRVHIPLIINVDDSYACERSFHIRQDIREVYETKEKMAMCHKSQILEWLPWTGGHTGPYTTEDFRREFRLRHERLNERYDRSDGVYCEYFQVTRWGRAPKEGELERLFPAMIENNYGKEDTRPDTEM